MIQKWIARVVLMFAIRNRKPLMRVARAAARRPGRTAAVAAGVQRAKVTAERFANDPQAKRQGRIAVSAAGRAAKRARELGAARAATDPGVLGELRAAAAAMSAGLAATEHQHSRRGRIGKIVVGAGMVGAGAYAGYRAHRDADQQVQVEVADGTVGATRTPR
jgi:hypothetical protein